MKEKTTTNYSDFIKGIELKNLYISSLTANREKDFHPPATIKIENEKDFEKLDNSDISMQVKYTLTAVEKGKKKPGFTISVEYTLLFQSKVEITEAHFKKFSRSLDVETWPYFRNLVNELTMRMGLPPLVLNVLKVMPKAAKKKKDAKD